MEHTGSSLSYQDGIAAQTSSLRKETQNAIQTMKMHILMTRIKVKLALMK